MIGGHVVSLGVRLTERLGKECAFGVAPSRSGGSRSALPDTGVRRRCPHVRKRGGWIARMGGSARRTGKRGALPLRGGGAHGRESVFWRRQAGGQSFVGAFRQWRGSGGGGANFAFGIWAFCGWKRGYPAGPGTKRPFHRGRDSLNLRKNNRLRPAAGGVASGISGIRGAAVPVGGRFCGPNVSSCGGQPADDH